MKTKEQVDARKIKLGAAEAMELIEQVNEVYVAKGKKVVHLKLKKEPADEETLKKLMLGPTGNLRAPAHRVGKILVVGFNSDTYETVFK